MADVPQTLATVLGALAQNIRPNVVRTYNRRSTLLRTLRVEQGEGKNCAWDWEGDAAVAESFADGADATNFGSDTENFASLAWGLYRANFRVTDLARAASKSSRTPEGLLRLWARNMMSAVSKMSSVINKDAFSGAAGGNNIVGLDAALHDANTYAGVDRTQAGNAGFRSSLIDPGALTKPTINLIRDDLRIMFETSGETPQIAMAKPNIYNKVGSLFDESRRRVQEIETSKGTVKLDGSLGGIEVEGCVFLKDKDATANTIYYIHTDAVHIEYVQQDDEADQPGTPGMSQMDDGFGAIPLGMKFKHLATTGSSEKASGQVFMQLVVTAPHMCGRRVNVDPS
jgi:hypothetical protein